MPEKKERNADRIFPPSQLMDPDRAISGDLDAPETYDKD